MTVEQLIERLQEFPPHHHVFVTSTIVEEACEATEVKATANSSVTIW